MYRFPNSFTWYQSTVFHTYRLLMCISELPSPFHQFGLLVALASAWSLTWYQSPGSRVWVLVFAIYCKIAVAPLCVHMLTFSSSDYVHVLTFSSPVWFHVLTFSSPLIRHTWVGVLMCISELPSPFISSDFWLRWLVHEAWQTTTRSQPHRSLTRLGKSPPFLSKFSVLVLP
jgi:hypothetical protein